MFRLNGYCYFVPHSIDIVKHITSNGDAVGVRLQLLSSLEGPLITEARMNSLYLGYNFTYGPVAAL